MRLTEDERLVLGLLRFVVQSVGPSAPPEAYLPIFEDLERKGMVHRTSKVAGTEDTCWNLTIQGRAALGEVLH